MRTLVLSDHAGDQFTALKQTRHTAHEEAMARYREQIEIRRQSRRQRWQRVRDTFDQRRFLATLGHSLIWFGLLIWPSPRRPIMDAMGQEERVWLSGHEGELAMQHALHKMFDDRWVLILGYRNAAGEMDQLLVGPDGMLALEIKNINGKYFCDGDRWWLDKFDKYGNLVEPNKPIADKGGRGPSQQVNDVADGLTRFLRQKIDVPDMGRSVVFTHQNSQEGKLKNKRVHMICHVRELRCRDIENLLKNVSGSVNVDAICRLIEQDHHFHSNRRNPRRAQ